ncbi:MAG TPA: VanZ family protein [Bacillus sp. (in: firmicutes)]|nr:VanZ family protein [Bacillus sp. (in: firmicutes)]
MKKWLLWLTMLGIIQFSNTPHLVVSDPSTWINKPQFEENVTIAFLVDTESVFYFPWMNVIQKEFILHKLGHVVFFSLLTIFMLLNMRETRLRYVNAWLWTTLFAFTDEVHQFFVVGRSGRFVDVLLDSTVSFICLISLYVFFSWQERRESSETISLQAFFKKG